MAKREQPYIPLYAMDFLGDEKLRECSASSVGVYIMLMCVLHKQEDYGQIKLREKDKKTDDVHRNFAAKLKKQLPFRGDVITRALRELTEERVLTIEGDRLYQKRMVKDAQLSDKRAEAGKKGAAVTNADAEMEPALQEPTHPTPEPEPQKPTNAETQLEPPEPTKTEAPMKPTKAENKKAVCERILEHYNRICTSFSPAKKLSGDRQKAICARLNTGYTEADFEQLFQKAEASLFLKGKNNNNWRANFDWLVKDRNMSRVLDGNYDEQGSEYNDGNGYDMDNAWKSFVPSTGFATFEEYEPWDRYADASPTEGLPLEETTSSPTKV